MSLYCALYSDSGRGRRLGGPQPRHPELVREAPVTGRPVRLPPFPPFFKPSTEIDECCWSRRRCSSRGHRGRRTHGVARKHRHNIETHPGLVRSRPKLNCGPGRDFEVGPEFGAARKQPIIPGNSRARSCAGEEDRVTWLDLRPG